MQRVMLHAKLHRVRVTATQLDYEGSVAIDVRLLAAAGIAEHEQLHIYDIANGERFTSYAVAAPAGSGEVSVLGAAARRVAVNDLLIICTYAGMDAEELAGHQPQRIYVDARNRIVGGDPPLVEEPGRVAV